MSLGITYPKGKKGDELQMTATITVFDVCPMCASTELVIHISEGELSMVKCQDCYASYSAAEVLTELQKQVQP